MEPRFSLGLNKKDIEVLQQIHNYFGVGKIYKQGSNAVQYSVRSIQELLVIIEHFDKYSLITQKQADYLLWRQVILMITRKEHLTPEGLKTILNIRASLNRGLSDKLKSAFLDVVPVQRPLVAYQKIFDPNWLSGFISAEGCFLVIIKKCKTTSLGFQVFLRFQLTQHSRDEQLLKSLIEYLGCGRVISSSGWVDFRVEKLFDLTDKVIPFLVKYPIVG